MSPIRPGNARLRILILSWAFLAASLLAGCSLPGENPFLYGLKATEFVQHGPTEVYNQDTLFDYIDGEAEVYMSLGFKLLYTSRYRKPGTDRGILVEAYDMGSSGGAKEVFQKYTRGNGGGIEGIGDAAWTDKAIILFWRDRYFLRLGPDPTEQTAEVPTLNDLKRLSHSMDHIVSRARHP